MSTDKMTNEVSTTNNGRPTGRIVAGVALLLPAILCCVTELFIPTARTFWLSLQRNTMLHEAEFVGADNYSRIFEDPVFGGALGFNVVSIIIRLIVVAIVPLLLAWAVGQFGRSIRLGARILLTIPIVLFVPFGIAVVWVLALHPIFGLFSFDAPLLAQPNAARTTLIFVDALYTFGLACGLGLIFYLPLWRRPDDTPPPTFKDVLKPLLGVWGVGILATIALTLTTFTLSFAMTRGGPANSTRTLGLWVYEVAFARFQLGYAASVASAILIIALVLGTVAGLLVIITRLQLTSVNKSDAQKPDDGETASRNKVLPAIILAITLLLGLGVCSISALPFAWVVPQSFSEQGFTFLLEEIPVVGVMVRTVFPPLLAAIIQLVMAYLAALSIGALKPLGKQSHWLLLLFSPWLFVTVLPLSLVSFMSASEAGILNTFIGLIPPILFSVPALFILTVFFKGQAARWQAAVEDKEPSAFFKRLILPSLPLAGVLFAFLLFIGWQDTFWPLLVSRSPESGTVSTAIFQILATYGFQRINVLAAGVTIFILPMSFLFFIVLAIFQLFYLDRLMLRAGDQ